MALDIAGGLAKNKWLKNLIETDRIPIFSQPLCASVVNLHLHLHLHLSFLKKMLTTRDQLNRITFFGKGD